MSDGVAWTDIETPRASGHPKMTLTGECQRIAKELGISRARQHQPHRDPRDGERDRDAGGVRIEFTTETRRARRRSW
jgi:hypothetical protein